MTRHVDEDEEKGGDLDAADDDPILEARRTLTRRLVAALLVLAIAVAPLVLSEYQIVLLDYVGLAAIVVLGLVLLTGIAGLTSFGHAAFVGVGAYVTGYLTAVHGLSPWLTLPLVIAVMLALSFVASAVTVRLSGHYLPLLHPRHRCQRLFPVRQFADHRRAIRNVRHPVHQPPGVPTCVGRRLSISWSGALC